MLQVDGKKMSKSLGNFFTVRDLIDKGFPGEVIRFVFLSTHYRKPMDWTLEKANQADTIIRRWYDKCRDIKNATTPSSEAIELLSDDLNTPGVIALLHKHFQNKNFVQLKADANLIGLMTPEFNDWSFNFDLSKLTNISLANILVVLVKEESVNQISIQLLFEGLGNPKKLEKNDINKSKIPFLQVNKKNDFAPTYLVRLLY